MNAYAQRKIHVKYQTFPVVAHAAPCVDLLSLNTFAQKSEHQKILSEVASDLYRPGKLSPPLQICPLTLLMHTRL